MARGSDDEEPGFATDSLVESIYTSLDNTNAGSGAFHSHTLQNRRRVPPVQSSSITNSWGGEDDSEDPTPKPLTPKSKRGGDGPAGAATLWTVAAIALPALGSVLADPLMSLVDTGCVGQVSSIELAALGPNTAIFNMVFQVFAFLGVTTTNILATNSVNAPGIDKTEKSRRLSVSRTMLCYSLTMAAVFGVCMAGIMQVWGPTLLKTVGTSSELLGPALEYLNIRALASPAVMVMNVAQGACLGQQDSWTPLKVFAAAGVLNLIGDWYLILSLNMGVAGAAIATTSAQYAGTAYFLWYLRRQGKLGRAIPLVWTGWPRLEELAPFMGVAGTLLSRTAFTMLAFTGVTAAATLMGTTYTAAHQVALQVFWFLCFVPEPLSMTAQSLIARDSTDPAKVRSLSWLLLRLGAFAGVALAAAMYGILFGLPWLFTSDQVVVAAMQPLANAGMCAILLCSLVMMCDGVSIGSCDFAHLPRTNAVGVAVAGTLLWYTHTRSLGLVMVWWSLATFFLVRLVQHALHAWLNWNASAFGRYQRPPPSLAMA